MKKKYWLLFFVSFQSFLFSAVPLPLSLGLYSGYRTDEFSWKLVTDTDEDVLIFREKYEHPRYIQTGASLTTINNGFYFLANFGYAPLLSHNMHITDTDSDSNEYIFGYKTKGYDLDGAIEIGVAANLTPDRIYKFYVIPLVGYNGFWKTYKRNNPHPGPYVDYQNSEKVNAYSSSSSRKLKQIWYGPYVGGKLYIVPNDVVSFDVSYHFNWMKLKLKFISFLEVFKWDQTDVLTLHEIITKNMNDTVSECYAHYAIAKVTFNTSKRVKLALLGRYNYYMSDKEKAILVTNTNELIPQNQQTKQNTVNKVYSRWWNMAGVIELIFQF